MKKHYIIAALALLLALLGFAAWRLCPRTLPLEECSDLYRRYAQVEGVDAAFVKDFPLGRDAKVDVTVLAAADSAGWDSLLRDANLASLPDANRRGIWTYYVQKDSGLGGNPDTAMLNNNTVAVDFVQKQICLFHTSSAKDINEFDAYMFHLMKKNTNLNIQPQTGKNNRKQDKTTKKQPT